MRIKKKDVIEEARLIDLSGEFTPNQKKILEVLYKKYGKGGMDNQNYDRWKAAAFLIEDFGLNWGEAYDLALTYWWYGDKLFEEGELLHKRENKGYVFENILREYIKDYVEYKKQSDRQDIELNWEDPNNIISGGVYKTRNSYEVWDSYRGFVLYIPFKSIKDEEGIMSLWRDSGKLGIMVTVRVKPYEQESPKTDTKINVVVKYDTLNSRNFNIELLNYDADIPFPLNKETLFKLLDDIVDNILKILPTKKLTIVKDEDD